jgi:chaperone BCS1
MFEFLSNLLKTNQFFSAGLVMMIVAGVGVVLRRIPSELWQRVKSQFIVELNIDDSDEAFGWVVQWLAQHPYGKERSRLLSVSTFSVDKDGSNVDSRRKFRLSPAPGIHFFTHRGRLLIVTRNRTEGQRDQMYGKPRESFTIQVLARDRSAGAQLMEDIRDVALPKDDVRVSISAYRYSDWEHCGYSRPRELDSVILKRGLMEEIVAAIEKFFADEQDYIRRGIPHRFGVREDGPPGNGKSSTVLAIASHFGLDIAILNLSSSDLNDDKLRDAFINLPKGTIVLIEDIDCIFRQREQNEKVGITYSGLLNAIDGVGAGEGRILFLTTNKPEVFDPDSSEKVQQIDPALARRGRCDLTVKIDNPDRDQIGRLFCRFHPGSQPADFIDAIAPRIGKLNMADLQGHLLKYNDPQAAIDNAAELLDTPQ